MSEGQVVLAAVTGAHGVGGEVRLKLFAENADSLLRHRQLQVAGRTLTPVSVRPVPGGAVIRFAEVSDRSSAEGLRGSVLTVSRDDLPPLEAGEYYHVDLIGLACRDRDGRTVGTVVGVENYGAGDLLEVETTAGKRALIPFKPGVADLDERGISLDPAFLA